jgi:hypothetical protein
MGSAAAQLWSPEISFLPNKITVEQEESLKPVYPNPKAVMRQSIILPGWGQVTNKQIWKVPIIYGMMGGLSYYSVYLTKEYHNYRAAFYNQSSGETDLRFGPTPDYLVGVDTNVLRENRNFLRSRRDMMYITIGMAYLLNVVDAYVFAHLKSFDVSDDLSMNTTIKPNVILADGLGHVPAISLSIAINR